MSITAGETLRKSHDDVRENTVNLKKMMTFHLEKMATVMEEFQKVQHSSKYWKNQLIELPVIFSFDQLL